MGSELKVESSFERSQIVSLQERLAAETTSRIIAENKSERLTSQIEALRRSFSWKITKPLRAFRRKTTNV